MARLAKAQVGMKGLLTTVAQLIVDWKPRALATELAYSNALADHLRASLPEDTRVEREYRHEGTTADIAILYTGILRNDSVYLELKRNLRKKAEHDRLIGQILGLKPDKHRIIVLLVGDCDAKLVGRLEEQFKSFTVAGTFDPLGTYVSMLILRKD